MKGPLLLLVLLALTHSITAYSGWRGHEEHMKENTEYVDINLCREFACNAADEEIKHWLNMFDLQQEHLMNCYGLNKVYREVMERNSECFQPVKPQDLKELQSDQ